jgi:hypothetical protein
MFTKFRPSCPEARVLTFSVMMKLLGTVGDTALPRRFAVIADGQGISKGPRVRRRPDELRRPSHTLPSRTRVVAVGFQLRPVDGATARLLRLDHLTRRKGVPLGRYAPVDSWPSRMLSPVNDIPAGGSRGSAGTPAGALFPVGIDRIRPTMDVRIGKAGIGQGPPRSTANRPGR